MRAHYLQHVPFEGLGSIEPWLLDSGYDITCTRLFARVHLPEPEAIDLLIVMGGPMSVNDEREHPWLVAEKRFIRTVIEAGKPTLGVCLGAQLMAAALGGEVYPNPVKEIGWLPIQAERQAHEATFRFPDEIVVFHWHGDTFTLPPGAVRLARSAVCENQAFQLGSRVLGLQFHLETTPESARALAENCRDELLPGEHIQSEAEILAAPAARYREINRLMDEVLSFLTEAP
ncbi:MAG: type 1 glutamine amidotransferase [Gammaproteobacteria bacterium]